MDFLFRITHGSMNEIIRVFKFLANGVLATLIHFLILILLIEVADLPSYGVANGIGAVFGIMASYVGNKLFVFQSKGDNKKSAQRFLILYAALFLWNITFLLIWSDYMELPYQIGFVIAVGIATIVSYLTNKIWVFEAS